MKSRYLSFAWIIGTPMICLIIGIMPRICCAQMQYQASNEVQNSYNEVSITWADIEKAVDGHPSVAMGRKQVLAANAEVDAAAGAVSNPSLEGTVAYGQGRDSSVSRVEWGLALSIPLDWTAHRKAKIKAAEASAGVTEAESEALRRDIILQLRLLFWDLVHEQEHVAVLVDLNRETNSFLETVKRRVEQGEARPIEVTRVMIEVDKLAVELETTGMFLKSKQAQLALWLGIGDKKIIAIGDLTMLPQPVSAEVSTIGFLQSHPYLRAAEANLKAIAAVVVLERRARIPTFSLQAFTDHELDRIATGLGLSMEFPLWNWNTKNIRKAEELLAAQNFRLDAERIALEVLLIEAQAECRSGVISASYYLNNIQPNAMSVARTIERSYELGESDLLDVLDSRRMLLETKTRTLEALARAQADCSRLNILVGEKLQ